MSIEVDVSERTPDYVLIRIRGRLDSQTIGDCERALKDKVSQETRYVTFDFEGLNYISSMGIRLLLIYRKVMESRTGKVLMANIPQKIRMVIDMANVLPAQGIFRSVEDADAFVAQAQG